MKRLCLIRTSLRFVCCLLLTVCFSTTLFAQLLPFNPARFGVDGDVAAGQRLSGSFDPAGSHDWFGGSYGVFDTTGAATFQERLSKGSNPVFIKKSQYPSFSVHDGLLMLGGTYARDYLGTGGTAELTEKTMFVPSAPNNKSYAPPGSWSTVPTGGTVPSKTDIIDTYIHMRRNGSSVSATNPSSLMLYAAASTLSTGGDHHLDFELYKSDITYSPVTGLFSAAGPATTGGRNIWEFNNDGSVKTFGEMTLSFSFNSSQVSDVALYIWVPYSTYATGNPKGFDFVAGEWNGASSFSGYGYARIRPKAGMALQAWAAVNTTSSPAPVWGTSSRESGSGANYYSAAYETGQFAEAAIDLTSLGIDPAFATSGNKCRSPYVKVMVKSRSSSAFSSALQDFVAPFELFEEPALPADIANPLLLTCVQGSQVLRPRQVIEGAVYKWSTTDGRIVSGANASEALVDRGGHYTLSVAPYEGCAETTAQVVVPADTTRPVASARYTGLLTDAENSSVTLWGGDEERSNIQTPFGGSQGLLWNWKGPSSFSSTEQNPVAAAEGTYRLTVTERRNGCTAIDSVVVSKVAQMILPLSLLHFSAQLEGNNALLSWQVAGNEEADRFEIERAAASTTATTGVLWASERKGAERYAFREPLPATGAAYRLRMLDKAGLVRFSPWVYLRNEPPASPAKLQIINPVVGDLVLRYSTLQEEQVTINVYHLSGRLLYAGQQRCVRGENRLAVPGRILVSNGFYTVEILGAASGRMVAKAIKE